MQINIHIHTHTHMQHIYLNPSKSAISLSPTVTLIPLLPGILDIPQHPLDLLHSILVAGVLAHVITELDGRAAICGSDFDDDVERFGFFAAGFVREVVCIAH